MKLSILHEEKIEPTGSVLLEAGYARVLDFKYDNFTVDPNPKILYLGKYRNRKTGNVLVGGVNLKYLDKEQVKRLRENLSDILRSGRTLKKRWAAGNRLLPDVFPKSHKGAYRTYDANMMHITSKSTITPAKSAREPEVTKTRSVPSARPPAARITPDIKPNVAPLRSSEKSVERQKDGEAPEPESEKSVTRQNGGDIEPTGAKQEVEVNTKEPEAARLPRRSSGKEPEPEAPDLETDSEGRAVDLTGNETVKKTGVGPKAREKKAEKSTEDQ